MTSASDLDPLPTARRDNDRRRAALAAVLLATFVLYAPSLANDFTWDDRHAAMGDGPTRQALVASLHPLADYFASNWWPQFEPAGRAYRPLTTLFFALRHAVCGDSAVVAHLLGVALHTLGAALCHLLLRRLGLPFAAALLGALVFGLHALHSEVAANLVGAAELLALDCGLLATLVLARTVASARPRRFAIGYPLAALLLFAAAASKESGLAWTLFAPLCVLAMHWRGALGRRPARTDFVALAATLLLPALLYLHLRNGMLAALPASTTAPVGLLDNPLLELPPLERAASGMLAWGYGLLLTALPFHLAVDYGPDQLPIVRDLATPEALASLGLALAFAALLVLAARHARARPLPALAAACFFGCSAVVTNVPIASLMHFAERSYTTPSLALAILVAAAAAAAKHWQPALRHGALALLAAWLVASASTAWSRNFVWADDGALIAHEVVHSPRSVRMQLAAGAIAARLRDTAAARAHFERAAELAPWLPQPWLELAELELYSGRIAAAAACADRAEHAAPCERARRASALRALRERVDAARAQPRPAPH